MSARNHRQGRRRDAGGGHDQALDEALRGVRALLLDMDGVLVSKGRPIPGAADAIALLRRKRIPFRVITNTSLASRRNLAGRLSQGGIDIAAGEIVTALSATAARLEQEIPGATVYLLGARDAPDEFAGSSVRLLADRDVDDGQRADTVVVGDSEDRLTYENLNRAFRQIRSGAGFVAMHRNPWWLTQAGPTLDSGALVVGLEYATGRRASVAGKPSPTIFREAVDELTRTLARDAQRDTNGPRHVSAGRLRREQVAMVGDDLRTDLAPARRLGMRTVLVLTGKHGEVELRAERARRRGFTPDAVASSVVDVARAMTAGAAVPGAATEPPEVTG